MAKRRKQKTKATAPGAKALRGIGDNSGGTLERSAAEVQRLFANHREHWHRGMAALSAARKKLSDIKAKLKADGFKVAQFQIADDLDDVTGEAKRSRQVDDILQVARWIGHPMGAQLDLFRDSKGTALIPSVDQAYENGKAASASNQPRKPPEYYSTAGGEYAAWMEGYDDNQRELAKGFKAPAKRGRKRKADLALIEGGGNGAGAPGPEAA